MAVQHYRLIEETTTTDPRAPDAMYRLGLMLNERGDRAEASTSSGRWRRGIPKHEAVPGALLVSGFALAGDGHYDEAINELESSGARPSAVAAGGGGALPKGGRDSPQTEPQATGPSAPC
jgi:hypothetical protein